MICASLEGAEMISTKDLIDIFPEMSEYSLRNLVSSLKNKGRLYRLKRGLYLVLHDQTMDSKVLMRSAPLVYPGYLAFSSALGVYGLLDYEPFTILISTVDRARIITVGEYELRYISMGHRSTGSIQKNGIWVSDLEKTIFDCFYKPQYAGGYQNITKALAQVKEIDWDRFLFYVDRYATKPLAQRMGYILEKCRDTFGLETPDHVLKELEDMVHVPARLMPSGLSKGNMDKKWKVLDNVGDEVYFGWLEDDG